MNDRGLCLSVFRRTLVILTLCGSVAAPVAARGAPGQYLGPMDVVASPDGAVLYVRQLDAQRIDVVDVATQTVTRSIACPGAPTGLAVAADGSRLYVTSGGPQGVVSVLEAQSCGAPVICSNTSSLPEAAGGGALLVDPLDVGAMAEAMRRVAADEALRRALVAGGYDNLARFRWGETAVSVLSTLEAAAQSSASV